MSTRRRVGFSTSSDASRRQLMQPVQCWEKVWTLPENVTGTGSTFKVYKWVKSDKKQQFSDDEGETDEPLAPLPDDPEAGDVDEDMDQDDARTSIAPDTTTVSREVSEPVALKDESSKATSPKPHPLSISFQPPSPTPAEEDILEESLKSAEGALDSEVGMPDHLTAGMDLDMAVLGPDGEPFEGAHDMTQLQDDDLLLGGPMMNQTEDDPFAMPHA